MSSEETPESQESTDKREPVIPIQEFTNQVEELHHALQKLLNEDVIEIKDNVEKLKDFAKLVKTASKNYVGASRKLSMRLTKIGAIQEAQVVRNFRTENITNVNEVITSINLFLNQQWECDFSLCTHSSVAGSDVGVSSDVESVAEGENQSHTSPSKPQMEGATDDGKGKVDVKNLVEPEKSVIDKNSPQRLNFNPPKFKAQPTGEKLATKPHTKLVKETAQGKDSNDSSVTMMHVMSKHLLQQDFMKQAIEPFGGSSLYFWSWLGKIKDYVEQFTLNPLQTLRLIEANTKGGPHEMLGYYHAATECVEESDIHAIWNDFITTYGSSHKIANELLEKINKFPEIKTENKNVAEMLQKLHGLCLIIKFNLPKCPELIEFNIAKGLICIRNKLPKHIQIEWKKVGIAYEQHHHCHPPFAYFVEFLQKQSKIEANKNYEILLPPSNNIRTTQD